MAQKGVNNIKFSTTAKKNIYKVFNNSEKKIFALFVIKYQTVNLFYTYRYVAIFSR